MALVNHPHSLAAVAVSPSRSLVGVDSQRVLSTLRYGVVTTSDPDPEALLSGRAAAKLGREEVTVSLAFGQLTRGDAAGTRVLIKEYRADQTPQTPTEIARAQLEGSLSGAPPGGLDQLEVALRVRRPLGRVDRRGDGRERICGHLRLQPPGGPTRRTATAASCQAARWSRRNRARSEWSSRGGEVTRMALPTRTPPTLATWPTSTRAQMLSAKVEANIPGRTCQLRGEYARALSTALG